MQTDINSVWTASLVDPSACRLQKPRQKGLTMIIDNGMGLLAFRDLLETAAPFIDFIKLGYGTSALYPHDILKQKTELARRHQILIHPGGTFFEVATLKGNLEEYLHTLQQLGFNALEISDGTVEIPANFRSHAIRTAFDMGFTVLSEYGKKVKGSQVDIGKLEETFEQDTKSGAAYLIVEGRESGKGVGIYDDQGQADMERLQQIRERFGQAVDSLIWEAPHKEQQVELLKFFGPHINFGNVAPIDVYSIESLRRGLRSDTFFFGL